jgi:hypothetical protein
VGWRASDSVGAERGSGCVIGNIVEKGYTLLDNLATHLCKDLIPNLDKFITNLR